MTTCSIKIRSFLSRNGIMNGKFVPFNAIMEKEQKKSKHKNKFSKIESSHLEVKGAILTKDCVCEETKKEYKKGTKFKTDGHTRDEYWWADYSTLDGVPQKVRVSYKECDTMAEVYTEYARIMTVLMMLNLHLIGLMVPIVMYLHIVV